MNIPTYSMEEYGQCILECVDRYKSSNHKHSRTEIFFVDCIL